MVEINKEFEYINPHKTKAVKFLGDTDVKIIISYDYDEGRIITQVKIKSEHWELDQGIYVLPRGGTLFIEGLQMKGEDK